MNPIYYEMYYKKYSVLYELLRQLKNREFSMLSKIKPEASIRKILITTAQSITFWFQNLKATSKLYNMYTSLATYRDGVPFRSGNLSTGIDNNFWDDPTSYFTGYDLLIDIDQNSNKTIDLNHGIETTQMIKDELTRLNCPFEMIFSGRGFHFVIPYSAFAENSEIQKTTFEPYKENSIYSIYFRINKGLHDTFSEMIDYNLSDSMRIRKMPFSLAVYKWKQDLYGNYITMCFPFKNEDVWGSFKQHPKEMIKPSYWNTNKIFKHGVALFNSNGNANQLLKEYGGV